MLRFLNQQAAPDIILQISTQLESKTLEQRIQSSVGSEQVELKPLDDQKRRRRFCMLYLFKDSFRNVFSISEAQGVFTAEKPSTNLSRELDLWTLLSKYTTVPTPQIP